MRGAVLALALATAGCAWHRKPGPPPPPPPVPHVAELPPANGSLWHPSLAINYPFVDVRARFPGDLLTILVSESAEGTKTGTTDTKANSTIGANVQDFFGIPAASVKFLPKAFNEDSIIKATTAREYKGDASTDRKDTMTASITVKVVSVDATGNLYVRGDKVVSVNREDQYIVLSGVVRPEDIANDNTVQSSRLGDARIDYYGHGSVGNKQRVPLVHTLMDFIWPF